jgi:hypothetical protein
VGTCDREPLLDNDPLATLPDVALLTSLFGGNCAGPLPGLDRIGAAEPCDRFSDGESGPKILDLGLELGIVDSLLIQDPLDETESLLGSSPKCSCGDEDENSPDLTIDSLLPLLYRVSILEFEERWWIIGGFEEDIVTRCEGLVSGVITVVLVAGRGIGEDMA